MRGLFEKAGGPWLYVRVIEVRHRDWEVHKLLGKPPTNLSAEDYEKYQENWDKEFKKNSKKIIDMAEDYTHKLQDISKDHNYLTGRMSRSIATEIRWATYPLCPLIFYIRTEMIWYSFWLFRFLKSRPGWRGSRRSAPPRSRNAALVAEPRSPIH